MSELVREANVLGALLEETRGVVGVALGTAGGQLRAVVGSVVDGVASAAVAAALTEGLGKLGALLGLGELGVASLKAPTASRVFARQAGAVVVIELDPKRPLGELEAKLQTVVWAPAPSPAGAVVEPMLGRVSSRPIAVRTDSPPPPPTDAVVEPMLGRVSSRPIAVRADSPPPPAGPARADSPPPPPAGPARADGPPPPAGPTRPAGEAARLPGRANRTAPPPLHDGALHRPGPPSAPPPPNRPPSPPQRDRPLRPTPSQLAGSPARPTSPPAALPQQMKSVGSGPVFTGDLEEFCLPDLLEFLRNSHRTGLLMCTTSIGVGTIAMSRGMIIGADSPNALDLREHFLTSPEVDPDRRRVLATLPPECFGDELVEGVLVSRALAAQDEVERARIARIYSAFREMMAWTAGRFSFDPGIPVVANPALALSAQSILMHIYQEQDEQGR
jgi:hypothetical protein